MRNSKNSSLGLSHIFSVVTLAVLVAGFTGGCAELSDPNYYPSSRGGYNNGYDDDDYYRRRESERNWEERRRLERERERLEEERRRHDNNHDWDRHRDPPPLQRPVPAPRDSCPSGFSPSEQKCSPSERARGCKDIRTPSGLGCVRR